MKLSCFLLCETSENTIIGGWRKFRHPPIPYDEQFLQDQVIANTLAAILFKHAQRPKNRSQRVVLDSTAKIGWAKALISLQRLFLIDFIISRDIIHPKRSIIKIRWKNSAKMLRLSELSPYPIRPSYTTPSEKRPEKSAKQNLPTDTMAAGT